VPAVLLARATGTSGGAGAAPDPYDTLRPLCTDMGLDSGSEMSEPMRDEMTDVVAEGKRENFAEGGCRGLMGPGFMAVSGGLLRGAGARCWDCLDLSDASGSVSVLCVFDPEE